MDKYDDWDDHIFRTCPVCGETKNVREYYYHGRRDGWKTRRGRCKACEAEARKIKYRAKLDRPVGKPVGSFA